MTDEGIVHECRLPLTIRDPQGTEHVLAINILGDVSQLVNEIRTQLLYSRDTRFSIFWAEDEITEEILKGLSSGDTLTLGELCDINDVKIAIQQSDLEALTRLHKGGVNFTARIPQTKLRPLQYALPNPEVLHHLCRMKVDLSQHQNDNNETILHLACYKNYKEQIITLLKYGADPNDVDIDGNTPIHILAQFSTPDIFDAVIEWSAFPINANKPNKQGAPPLLFACSRCSEIGRLIVLKLIQQGACPSNGIRYATEKLGYKMVDILKDLYLIHLEKSVVEKSELPKSREWYYGKCDPALMKEIHRNNIGAKLPRTRPSKVSYQSHVDREFNFVSKENEFHDSKKMSGMTYADMVIGTTF